MEAKSTEMRTLHSTCVFAIFACTLAGQGQSTCNAPDPAGVGPSVILPCSDPSNKGDWTPDASMSDEFDQGQLDLKKWATNVTGWPGRPPALFVDRNVTMASGNLQITMRKEVIDKKYAHLGYHDYTTGAVQSAKSVLYGYFEVRARAMKSAGSSGLWFVGKDPNNWNEIDLAEMGGKPPAHPRTVFMSVHVFEKDGVRVTQNDTAKALVDRDLADDFHVYGLDWSAASLDFYMDGHLLHHLTNTSWHTPATMILDAETQVSWWGMPKDTDLPSVFTIDYVRAWTSAAPAKMHACAPSPNP